MEGISIRILEEEVEGIQREDHEVQDPEEGSIMGDKLCILTFLRKYRIIKIYH